MMQEAVLIIGGSSLQISAIHAAHSLGLAAIITDQLMTCPGTRFAEEFIPISTYDIEGHRRLIPQLQTRWGLRGVMCCGNDVAPTVAACVEELGTPGIPYEVACRTHDKALVLGTLVDDTFDAYMPDWDPIYPHEQAPVAAVADFLRRYPQGCVLKPIKQRASRGVSIVHSEQEIDVAVRKVLEYSRLGDEFIVEELWTGTEHSAEVIFGADGAPVFFNIVDRIFTYDGGAPIERGHVNPSRVGQPRWSQAFSLLKDVARALGIMWGPFKADLMLTDKGWKILEVTARLSGGWDCQATTPLSSGRNPVRAVCSLACGLPVLAHDVEPSRRCYAACAAAFPKPGRVVALPDPDALRWLRGVPGVQRIEIGVRVGDLIEPYQHNAQRPAFVMAISESYDAAWTLAEQGAQAVEAAIVTREVR